MLKDNFSTRVSSPHLSCGVHGPIQVVRLSGKHLSLIEPFCWSNIFYIGTRFMNVDLSDMQVVVSAKIENWCPPPLLVEL